jgi:ABC-type sulfate transport system permease component
MLRFLAALIGLVAGYAAFAFAGYGAIAVFSDNAFDRSLEASMTAAFVIGPAGGVVGLVVGFILSRPKPKAV